MRSQRGIVSGIIIFIIGMAMLLLGGVGAFAFQKRLAGIGGGYVSSGGAGIACDNGLTAEIPLSGAPGLMEGPPVEKASRVENTKLYLTAYYTPQKNQEEYVLGSYQRETRMEGNDTTASGQKTAILGVAAPPSYPFGTRIYIPGYGLSTVVDRGCDIQEAGVGSKCPGLANTKAPHDHIDIMVGRGDAGREAMKGWHGKIVEAKIYWFDNMSTSERKSYLNICKPVVSSGGTIGGGVIEGDYVKLNVPLLRQATDNSCSRAAVGMVANYYGANYTPEDTVASGFETVSYSLSRLKRHSGKNWKIGRVTEDISSWETVMTALKKGNPVILMQRLYWSTSCTTSRASQGHVIVITGFDPATQELMINSSRTDRSVSCRIKLSKMAQFSNLNHFNSSRSRGRIIYSHE
jgi:3D (Asp-Asp-Asp) domain-containing protein